MGGNRDHFDLESIRSRIERVAQSESDLEPTIAHDVAFHMTDWLESLEEYIDFLSDPSGFSDEQVERILLDFLTHVPNHLAAASKLFIDIPVTDVFGVNATLQVDEE